MKDFPSIVFDNFIGMDSSDDKLSLLPGQFSLVQNMFYSKTGGILKCGGGAKLSDPPSTGILYGLGNYRNNSGSEYLICAQGTDLYYYSSVWNALSLSLTSNQKTRFEQAGYSTNRALYAVNGSDTLIKIYMSGLSVIAKKVNVANGFTYDAPSSCTSIKLHKNRLFLADKDTLYFSDSLAFDNYPSSNNIQIAPGIDGYIKALEVWGDALFIFKEYGIYVLPNASDANPTSAWKILRADSIIGTKSPDTVKRTKIGIIFLSSDNYIMVISPNISFSSAEYTLGGSGANIISHSISSYMDLIDNSNKQNATAIEFENKYILFFRSISNGSSYNDVGVFLDIEKFYQKKGIATPQPYCGILTGLDFDYLTTQSVSDKIQLYGAKGIDGTVHEALNSSIKNNNSLPINGYAVLGWMSFNDDALYKKFRQAYISGKTENNIVVLKYDGYKLTSDIPSNGSGISKDFQSDPIGNAIVGTAIVDTSIIGSIGITAKKYRLGLKGHFFKIEFQNNIVDQYFSIDKIILYYLPIKRS